MGFKSALKKTFWGRYLISISHCVRCRIEPALMNDEKAVRRYYKRKSGNNLELNNPQTFCEKLNWYKLNARDPLMQKCADKVAVREYILEKGYAECLNTVYGIYDRVEDIDINSLPDQFVIKAAHGSHMNYIVKDKNSFDWKRAKRMMKTWLHQDIYWSGREWVYKDIPKRLIVEKYLEDETGELRDFKFYCYHGKPYFIQFDIGRYSDIHYRNFYEISGKLLNLCDNEKLPINKTVPFPIESKTFRKIIKMCEDLSAPFQQVRVDLYVISNKIKFGELTFFDGGGSTIFYPEEWNVKFSEAWVPMK